MRKVLFMAICLFTTLSINAQEFKFEKIIEVNKTQSELYSLSKMFVTDFWNSAKNVTQNQDDAACTIQLKAIKEMEVKAGMGLVNLYIYKYSVKFQTKDNKCRVQIYNVKCIDAYQAGLGTKHKIPQIQPFTGNDTNQKTKSMGKGISKKKAVEMMQELNAFFNSIITSYEKQLERSIDDNW